jgi:hypothetical protein
MPRTLILLGIALFVYTGCARPPQTLEYPSMRILYDKTNQAEPFKVLIEGRLINTSDSAAFVDYSADAVLLANGKEILSLKVTKDRVFPFQKQAVHVEKNFSKDQFAPFAAAFSLDAAAIEKSGMSNPVELGEKNFKFSNVKATKKEILTLLKDGKK